MKEEFDINDDLKITNIYMSDWEYLLELVERSVHHIISDVNHMSLSDEREVSYVGVSAANKL